jgi:hypothetical protein
MLETDMKPFPVVALISLVGLSACSAEPETVPAAETSELASASDAVTIESAEADAEPEIAGEAEIASQNAFPVALVGKWRLTEGPAPTAGQCDGNVSSNIGKVMEVRESRFSVFETGGTITQVKQRDDSRIRAVFDTTYADTPTSADLTFAVDAINRTLTVTDNGGRESPLVYKRCPR